MQNFNIVQFITFIYLYTASNIGVTKGEFFPFGMKEGDTLFVSGRENEINSSIPFVFYNSSYQEIHINENGLVSFGTMPLTGRTYRRDSGVSLPSIGDVGRTPFLAPFWSYITTSNGGRIFFRSTTNSGLIRRVTELISGSNAELQSFQPKLLLIATWKEVELVESNQNLNVSFQVILATDGIHSFSIFLYGLIHRDAIYLTGFNGGDETSGAIVAASEISGFQNMLQTSFFRIDGLCVTNSSTSCPLLSFSTTCSSPPNSFMDSSCMCYLGFSMDSNGTCQDIDECSMFTDLCPPGSTCVNLYGRDMYYCPCQDGFYGNDISLCIDINECAAGIHTCDRNANCTNTIGSFNCSCNHGYLDDRGACIEEDTAVNCTEGSPNCMCTDRTGAIGCYCQTGFNITSEGGNCTDIDECMEGTSLCTSVCQNLPGSYFCTCLAGFYLDTDGFTCRDINECSSDQLNDCHNNANCTNTVGSFSCECNDGFNGNGRNCFTADICSTGTHSCQHICDPTEGNTFRCLCNPGFTLDNDGVSCNDLDECAAGLDNCNKEANCNNTIGSFDCICGQGYYGNGITCIDIDECSDNLHNCSVTKNCANTPGSFQCSCRSGFLPSPANPNECLRGQDPIISVTPVIRPLSELVYSIGNDFCLETEDTDPDETLTITCNPEGVEFPSANVTWIIIINFMRVFLPDIMIFPSIEVNSIAGDDSVLVPLTIIHGLLTDRRNHDRRVSFICERVNVIGNDIQRTSIHVCGPTECQDGITNNCSHICARNQSRYSCSCDKGYELASDLVSCEDINECDPSSPMHDCSLDSTLCSNLPGSYTCDCIQGYEVNSNSLTFCNDIDECSSNMHNCSGLCNNTPGSFACSCEQGFELAGDGFSCLDVDECLLSQHNCTDAEFCINSEGSFFCNCSQGYENTDTGCQDIDECVVDPGICDRRTQCINTNGSYTCSCNALFNNCQVSPAALYGGTFGGVGFIVLVIIVVIMILLFLRTAKLKKENQFVRNAHRNNTYLIADRVDLYSPPMEPSYSPPMELSSLSVLPQSLKISIQELQFDSKMVGEGEFGIVHKAKYRGDLVAVKTLKGFHDNYILKSLVDEILKMKEFSHRHILTLRGVAFDSRHSPYIVMPYMSNGSLKDYLKKETIREDLLLSEGADIDAVTNATKKLMNMSLQVAKGMEYLTSKKVIHRDLAARNCMMDIHHVIKVADFGLSVSMTEDKNYFRAGTQTGEKLPVKWMAPEALLDHKFSEMSDVWSYGVTCWEVFSCGRNPYPTIKSADLLIEIQRGRTLEKPINIACNDSIYSIMQRCWAREPSNRPTFSVIIQDLSQVLMDFAGYLDLSNLSSIQSSFDIPDDFEDGKEMILTNHNGVGFELEPNTVSPATEEL